MNRFYRGDGPGILFERDSCLKRGPKYPTIQVAMAMAAWPFEGFGNKFDTTSNYCTPYYSGSYNNEASLVFDTSDRTFTYQKITYRIDYDTGAWKQQIVEFFSYWKNGLGVSTKVTHAETNSGTGSSDPLPVGNGGYTPGSYAYVDSNGAQTVTDLTCTRDGTLAFVTGPVGMPSHINWTAVATLSQERLYADCVSDADTALATLDIPPFNPISGGSPTTPTIRTDIIYPNSSGSGNSVYVNSGAEYLVGACRGMQANSTSTVYGNQIAADSPYSIPNYAVMSAKSRWKMQPNGAFSYATPPFSLYNHPFDNTFEPQSVVDLLAHTSLGNEYEFNINQIPPYGFVGSYSLNTPYSPAGYGELGFSNTAHT